jgi:hypothetical protein
MHGAEHLQFDFRKKLISAAGRKQYYQLSKLLCRYLIALKHTVNEQLMKNGKGAGNRNLQLFLFLNKAIGERTPYYAFNPNIYPVSRVAIPVAWTKINFI